MVVDTNTKNRYICGSTDPDKFKEMCKIVYHYSHETPTFYKKRLLNNKLYQALSVMVTKAEEELIRQEIKWIGVPEGVRVEL